MRGNGKRINSTDMAKSIGLTKLCIKDNINLAKNMERGCFCGKMTALTKVSSLKTIFMGLESIYGRMVEFTKENGKTTKWKEKESLLGWMVVDIKANIKTTKKKDLEFSHFETEGFTKESGKTVNSTERAFFERKTSLVREYGKMGNEWNGWRRLSKTKRLREKVTSIDQYFGLNDITSNY